MAGWGLAVKASWATLCFGLFVHGRVWFGSRGALRSGKLRRVELSFGAFGCVLAVKVMRVMLRLSGYWQGSQGKARSGKVKHGRVRFGSRGLLWQGGFSYGKVRQSWCVQLSIVGFSNGLAVVAS